MHHEIHIIQQPCAYAVLKHFKWQLANVALNETGPYLSQPH